MSGWITLHRVEGGEIECRAKYISARRASTGGETSVVYCGHFLFNVAEPLHEIRQLIDEAEREASAEIAISGDNGLKRLVPPRLTKPADVEVGP